MSPLLAQSGHNELHCTCPLFGGKADMANALRNVHERLAQQAPVFETRGVGRFNVVETKWGTHSAYAVYSVSLAGDPGPTSFSNRTRSWTVPNGFSNNGTPS